MKKLNDIRFIEILAFGINGFFYLHILIFIGLLVFNHFNPFEDPFELTIRGKVEVYENNWKPMPVENLTETNDPIFLMYKSGFIRFDYESWSKVLTLNNMAYFTVDNFYKFLWLFITFQVRNIVISISNSKIFEAENLTRVRKIGIVVLLMPFVEYISNRLFLIIVKSQVSIEGHFFGISRDFNEPVLAAAILIFIIGEVFRLGINLQNETDLTV